MKFEKKPATNSTQFDLRWLFGSIALLSICFAAVATKGNAIGIVIVAGSLTPAFVLAWIAFTYFRDRTFGTKSEPLASTKRDPLGINEAARMKQEQNSVDEKN